MNTTINTETTLGGLDSFLKAKGARMTMIGQASGRCDVQIIVGGLVVASASGDSFSAAIADAVAAAERVCGAPKCEIVRTPAEVVAEASRAAKRLRDAERRRKVERQVQDAARAIAARNGTVRS